MGLFDRLFGDKKKEVSPEQEEEQVVAEELLEESISDNDGFMVNTEAKDERMEESMHDSEEVVPAEIVLSPEQEAQKQRSLEVMERYYAEKAALAARIEEAKATGESVAVETKPVEVVETVQELVETEEEKYERSLAKTRKGFGARLNEFFANFRTVDEEFFEELEELLILSDVGVQVASTLAEDLRYEAKLQKAKKSSDLQRVILEKLVDIYEKDGQFKEEINLQAGLTVMLFVGVNGVGKTTSIGKLAHKYKQAGKKVMLVAADTFRAGAVAQLVEWGNRVHVPVVTGPEKSDPASVVFDGMERAIAEGVEILMIDTAGRLQNKDNLMAELEKIGRIIKRVLPEAPHETLLAVDASTGQNALVQAKEFSKITPLTGLVLTKIDGTARGGVVLAIRQELDIPVKFIGFGEKLDDIGEFKSEEFMKGLLEGLV
ncbi:signal recognition particle-docking protein FtsY [Streptococcus ovis]|uniref:signal recognition particle-docking protein FtsY n=1 Tax=Streptococcus ovis TaxID=82806 RepID=UPI00037108DB|nr:signal recognition particle-docking protein FtsY [Streptococcus ovis]